MNFCKSLNNRSVNLCSIFSKAVWEDKAFPATGNAVKPVTKWIISVGLILSVLASKPALAEPYYWTFSATYTPYSSPKEGCQSKQESMIDTFGENKIGGYRLEQRHETAYRCYITRKGTYGNYEQHWTIGRKGDGCLAPKIFDTDTGECTDLNIGPPVACGVGNPINPVTGYKYQIESDYQGAGAFPLAFDRFYNGTGESGVWTHSYQQRVDVVDYTNFQIALVKRPNGRVYRFTSTDRISWEASPNVTFKLERITDGAGKHTSWQLTTDQDVTESYHPYGHLKSITNQFGLTHTLFYNGQIVTVADTFGRSIQFETDENDRLVSFTDPLGGLYSYDYDANGRISTVTYPDNSPQDRSDNPVRSYLYENPDFPFALTGIQDERGVRFATWKYDSLGRAVSSEHSGGAEKVELDYTHLNDVAAPRITVTNELGKQTTYHYVTINGIRKISQIDGHASANCAAAASSYTYDQNGFPDLITDWQGHITDYDFNARGLEVRRVEGLHANEQRVIETEWHPTFRLPVKVTSPQRITLFQYDAGGRLISKTTTPNTEGSY